VKQGATDYSQELLQSNEEYNNRIKEMYDEINSTRKEYEGRIKQLKQSNEQLKQNKIDKDKK
jgi:HEAT repeat protein